MPLGQRQAGGRAGDGGELTRFLSIAALVLFPLAAAGQRAAPATVGPGRIICNATFCELGVGGAGKQRTRIDISTLPEGDRRRLRRCTGVSKPCIVTINGIEQGDKRQVMARDIHWDD